MASIRRLAAIFAADAAGYSRLMGADEEGTLDRLNAYRREIVDPKIEEQAPRVGAGISSHLDQSRPALILRGRS